MKTFPFVLLRGLGRESRHWGGFVDLLAKQPFCSNVFTPDCPGTGKYISKSAPWTISENVEALRQQISVNEPVVLFGLSMGGMFALDWFLRYPKETSGCFLVNSSMASCSGPFKRFRPRNYAKVARSLVDFSIESRERRVLSMVSFRADEPVEKLWIDIQKSAPVKQETVLKQLLAAAIFAPKQKLSEKKRKELMVLCSRDDGLVDYRASVAIAKKYGCGLAMTAGSGHDIPIDDPEWLIRQIAGFVSR